MTGLESTWNVTLYKDVPEGVVIYMLGHVSISSGIFSACLAMCP